LGHGWFTQAKNLGSVDVSFSSLLEPLFSSCKAKEAAQPFGVSLKKTATRHCLQFIWKKQIFLSRFDGHFFRFNRGENETATDPTAEVRKYFMFKTISDFSAFV